MYKSEGLERVNGEEALVFEIAARKNSRPVCSCCGKAGAGYDLTTQIRLYPFVPLWGYQVYFRYRKRRVNCECCGVKVERVPWAQGKQQLTWVYRQYLAMWAKRLSWIDVARAFNTRWEHVYQSVKGAVEYGLAHRRLTGSKRLLSIVPQRTVKSLLRCFGSSVVKVVRV